jgi:hypothetical protein
MTRLKLFGGGLAALLVLLGLVIAGHVLRTEREIAAFRTAVADLARDTGPFEPDAAARPALPAPVRRYFDFVFPRGIPDYTLVRLEQAGDFRRPLTEGFNPTTGEQVIAANTPAMVFSATTPILPGIWARAYDVFADGRMQMKARILSALTVVDEAESPELNAVSLRRWLLESALYPRALLPGGPVRWEPLDDTRARAIVGLDGLEASLIAHFDAEGRMTRMTAEADGDLTTPYHGSGEDVTRGDYQNVGGQMIPMTFTISRAAGGAVLPFWTGRVVSITFE